MSATGRGKKRVENDFYGTPASAVRRYLDFRALNLPDDRWLEPSSGNGAIIRATNDWFDHYDAERPHWTGVELDTKHAPAIGYPCLYGVSFLDPKVTTDRKYDFCIGNPPYSLAQEFIEKALTLADEVAFLLRLNFLESSKRHAFFRSTPCDVRVLPNRPSFEGNGKTDATAYAWFEFGKGHGGRFSVLGLTSKEERRADRG